MTIEVTDLPRSYAGQYYGKSVGITYLIKVDPNYLDDDTLLHETVHHARLVDKGRGSNLVKSRSVYPDRVGVRGNGMALEEAATVAETHARQGDYRVSSNPH
jgi:extradiol dioxygenase family protein